MAKVKFVLNRKGLREQVLRSPDLAALLSAKAEAAAPSGCVVQMRDGRTRTEARILDPSSDGLAREAVEGHLSRAIGLSAENRKVWYTTKAGKRRLATQAQANNWSRGS